MKRDGALPHRMPCLAPWLDWSPLAGQVIQPPRKQGKFMTNTIELLEAIGRDASLRHATGDDLSRALSALQASEGLKQAALSGDDGYLAQEFGHREVNSTNTVNNGIGGGCEDCESDDEGNGEDDADPAKSE